jgi:hypothetical protein
VHYITAVHLSGGTAEAHITSVRWLNSSTGMSGTTSVDGMVAWLRKGNQAQVAGPDGPVQVVVVDSPGGTPYLRTVANGDWSDNLLALPRY